MAGQDFRTELVVGDGEHADVQALPGLPAQLADLPPTLLAGTEIGAGAAARRRRGNLQGAHHLLQPLQGGYPFALLLHEDQLTHQVEGTVAQETHLVGRQLAAQLA